MILHSFGGGVFPDVVFRRGRAVVAYREGDPRQAGRLLVVEFPADALVQADHTLVVPPPLLYAGELPPGSPAFPKLAILDDLTWLVYHDGAHLQLRQLESNRAETLPAFGNCPAVFGGAWLYWQVSATYAVSRISLQNGAIDLNIRTGAPTGLSRVTEGGAVITVDEDRHALAGTTIPCFAGDLACGEGPQGGAVWQLGTERGLLWPGRDCFTPRCARSITHTAVVTFGPDVRVFVGTPQELSTFVPIDPQPPMTPDRFDVVRDQWTKQPAKPNSTESCGEFTRRVAWALNSAGDPNGWGLLSKSSGEGHYEAPNHPGVLTAVDAIIYGPTQQVVDILGGAEGPNPQPGWMEVEKRPSNNWVAPRVPLDGDPDPDPDPNPDPDIDPRIVRLIMESGARTQVSLGHVANALDEVREALARLEARPTAALTPEQLRQLEALRQLLDHLKNGFSTSRAIGHAHAVRWEPTR